MILSFIRLTVTNVSVIICMKSYERNDRKEILYVGGEKTRNKEKTYFNGLEPAPTISKEWSACQCNK